MKHFNSFLWDQLCSHLHNLCLEKAIKPAEVGSSQVSIYLSRSSSKNSKRSPYWLHVTSVWGQHVSHVGSKMSHFHNYNFLIKTKFWYQFSVSIITNIHKSYLARETFLTRIEVWQHRNCQKLQAEQNSSRGNLNFLIRFI